MTQKYSDIEIIEGIKTGGIQEERFLKFLYQKNKTAVIDLILKNKGSLEEAKDVYQDAIVALYENIKASKYRGESAIGSYLYSIARFIWLNRLKRKSIEQKVLDIQRPTEVQMSHLNKILEKEQEQKIIAIFQSLGEQCKEVLVYSIYYEYSMKEIFEKMDYKNEQVVRNKKSKCMKQLKKMIELQPEILKLLKS